MAGETTSGNYILKEINDAGKEEYVISYCDFDKAALDPLMQKSSSRIKMVGDKKGKTILRVVFCADFIPSTSYIYMEIDS
jgi:hypothetical protein